MRPPAGVLSDYQIIQRLAARVGLGDEFADDVRSWQQRLLSRVAPLVPACRNWNKARCEIRWPRKSFSRIDVSPRPTAKPICCQVCLMIACHRPPCRPCDSLRFPPNGAGFAMGGRAATGTCDRQSPSVSGSRGLRRTIRGAYVFDRFTHRAARAGSPTTPGCRPDGQRRMAVQRSLRQCFDSGRIDRRGRRCRVLRHAGHVAYSAGGNGR